MFRAVLAALALTVAAGASAEWTGVVFLDADGDGLRGNGERAVPDVAVTNGVTVVRTDAEGRYRLPEREGFLALVRPSGYASPRWYARGSSDFALRPAPQEEAFFFVQISDAHVYRDTADFAEFSSYPFPWWVPQVVGDWLTLRFLRERYEQNGDEPLGARFREALAPYRDAADLSDLGAYRAWSDELSRPGSELGGVDEAARAAFAEVAALSPDFVVHTGDLVLEGNRGTPEAMDRWFEFYAELRETLGVPVYDTIGNNELAGTENPCLPGDDARFARRPFEERFGPSWYAFDRAGFHFVALDTHRPAPTEDDSRHWSFGRMPDDEAAWLDADLAAHTGRALVVLNHEPFHYDPAWPFGEPDPDQTADDEGLFERHGVSYVLSGHTHWRSFQREGELTHITTGALSGLRWVLPTNIHERGYRLFWAREGELHSGWKRTGEPLIDWAEGGRQDDLVVVAADVAGPFEAVAIESGGVPVAAERWGDYFLRLAEPPTAPLLVEARRAGGARLFVELQPR